MTYETPRPIWREHLTLITSVSVFAIFGIKVVAAARGSGITALAIVQESSPDEVVLGIAIVVLVPLMGGMILGLLLGHGFMAAVSGQRIWDFCVALLWFATVAIGLLAPWTVVVAIVGAVGLMVLARKTKHPVDPAALRAGYPRTGFLVATYSVLLASFLISSDSLWIPPQEFTLEDGSRLVGYELAKDEQDFVVLSEGDRTVERITRTAVVRTRLCALGGRDRARPLIYRFQGSPLAQYPRCRASDVPR
jgi:hypothetical protein